MRSTYEIVVNSLYFYLHRHANLSILMNEHQDPFQYLFKIKICVATLDILSSLRKHNSSQLEAEIQVRFWHLNT